MSCERCGGTTHRDDAMVRRCDGCERIVRMCDCAPTPLSMLDDREGRWMDANGHIWHRPWRPSIPATWLPSEGLDALLSVLAGESLEDYVRRTGKALSENAQEKPPDPKAEG